MRPLFLLFFVFQMLLALRGQSGVTLPATAAPAGKAIFFKNYTTRDGLPHGLVNLIFEDSRGFVWLSAQTGLVRYDGFAFTPIFGEGSGKEVPYSEVLSMAEDPAGRLWASTNDGRLLHFDGLSPDFSTARFDSLAPKGSILKTGHDSIWLVVPNGLLVYQPSVGRFCKISWANPVFENDAARRAGLPGSTHTAVFDAVGDLWLTTENPADNGLYRWKMDGNRWAWFPCPSPVGSRTMGHQINIDPTDGAVYCFGWDGGLRRFLPAAGRWETFRFDGADKIAIHFIAPKNGRELWLGTENGISVFDKKSRRAQDWQHRENDPNSLLPARKACCCICRNGSVWVGGNGGASCIDPSMQTFARRDVLPPDEHVSALFKDTLGRRVFWATGNPTLLKINLFCADESLPNQKPELVCQNSSLQNGLIAFMLRDRSSNFYWVGTEKGLFQMGAKTFRLRPVEPKSFAGKKPFRFAETCFRTGKFDQTGTLWLGTFGYGVVHFDPKTGNWRQWLPQTSDPNGFYVREILCDRQGKVWAGSVRNDGLAVFDPATGRDLQLDTTAVWQRVFHDKAVSGLAEDGAGNIWAGTSAGLVRCRLSPSGVFEAEKIRQINEAVFYMTFDESGWLWMKTNSGVQRLDPQTGALQVFNEKNGLDADLSFGRFYRADDGEFFFGENYRWRAEDIASKTESVPQVSITAVHLFDQLLAPEKWAAPGQKLQLTHLENALVFEFSALNMNQPADCRYHWQLRGFNPLRTTNGGPGEHRATFNNLPPGDYVFEVWADSESSPDGEKNRAALAFHIEPPFWARWWFRSIVAVFLTGLAWFFYKNRLNIATAAAKIRQQNAELQQKEAEYQQGMAEMEIAALRAQMNPHFLFNSFGTLEAFIAEHRTVEAAEMLHKFSRLTRMVLENSAFSVIPLKDDLAALRLYTELEQTRFQNSFRVEWNLDAAILNENPNVPPLLIQPFVENAILHGLRNKKTGDNWLKISLHREADTLVFEIADNGVGRKLAGQLSAQKSGGQQSLGGRLTERRIQLLNQSNQQTASVRVQNLFENIPETGTSVKIRLNILD